MRTWSGEPRCNLRDEDRIRFQHMIDAAETVARFVDGRERADLDSDQMLFFAVVRAIEVLGEAASRISEEAKADFVEVPWVSVVGMRNRLVHGYFDINADLVWKTATTEIPALITPLRRAIGS